MIPGATGYYFLRHITTVSKKAISVNMHCRQACNHKEHFIMKSFYVLSLVVILAVAASQIVFAQDNTNNPGNGQGRMGMQGMGARGSSGALAVTNLPNLALLTNQNSTLNLTADQVTAVTNLLDAYQKALAATPVNPGEKESKLDAAKTLANANKALRDALMSRTADTDEGAADIAKKIKACRAAEDVVIAINIKYWGEMRKILTDTQLTQLNQMLTPRVRGANNTRGGGGQNRNRQDNSGGNASGGL
jgi:hypothetical protein